MSPCSTAESGSGFVAEKSRGSAWGDPSQFIHRYASHETGEELSSGMGSVRMEAKTRMRGESLGGPIEAKRRALLVSVKGGQLRTLAIRNGSHL